MTNRRNIRHSVITLDILWNCDGFAVWWLLIWRNLHHFFQMSDIIFNGLLQFITCYELFLVHPEFRFSLLTPLYNMKSSKTEKCSGKEGRGGLIDFGSEVLTVIYWVLGLYPSTGIATGRWKESKNPAIQSKVYSDLCETKLASLCYA
jgi:hypothetical protein